MGPPDEELSSYDTIKEIWIITKRIVRATLFLPADTGR